MAVIFDSAYFLADAAFAAGMGMALNADKTMAVGRSIVDGILEGEVLGKKKVPLHLRKALTDDFPKWTTRVIQAILAFCMAWTILTNIFGTTSRNSILTILYVVYPWATATISVPDILLDDDKKLWNVDIKKRHVLFPLDFEASKTFASELTGTQRNAQMVITSNKLKAEATKFAKLSAVSLLAFYFLPPVIWFFGAPLLLAAHNSMNLVFNLAFDWFSYEAFNNKFDSIFGDYKGIIVDGETHDNYGRHYQYFNYSLKPLEKFCYQQFFKRARAKKFSVAQSKAAYYLGRGAVVMTVLVALNILNYQYLGGEGKIYGVAGALLPYAIYYGTHAAIAYHNQGKDDWFDQAWKRLLFAAIPESIFAGYLFYKPMFDILKNKL